MLIPGHEIKIKAIAEPTCDDLNNQVNSFLADLDHKVVDIKFSSAIAEVDGYGSSAFSAMIIYTKVKTDS